MGASVVFFSDHVSWPAPTLSQFNSATSCSFLSAEGRNGGMLLAFAAEQCKVDFCCLRFQRCSPGGVPCDVPDALRFKGTITDWYCPKRRAGRARVVPILTWALLRLNGVRAPASNFTLASQEKLRGNRPRREVLRKAERSPVRIWTYHGCTESR